MELPDFRGFPSRVIELVRIPPSIVDSRRKTPCISSVNVAGRWMREAIEVASPAKREELCRIVVQRVVVRNRELDAIDWVPAARPFFQRQREYPQGDSNP